MNLIPVIRDLLLRNQKAIIPGLGSLVIIQRPAQINKVTREIAPPRMIIRFEKDTQADDGSLLGYLVRKLKIDTQHAENTILEFVRNGEETLKTDHKLVMDGLGTLTEQKSGDISFEPDAELLKRISLFELPKINIHTEEPAKHAVIPAPVSTPAYYKESRKRRWWIPVGILALLMTLLAPIYITGNLDTLLSDITGFFTGEKKNPEKEKLVFGNSVQSEDDTATRQISRKLDEQVDRDKALAYEQAENTQAQPETGSIEVPVNQTVPVTGKPYQVISGAFLVPNNAEKHKAQLEKKGFSPVILPKKGDYYMVTLGSFDNMAEATAAMKQMQTKLDNELWVLKRK